MRVVRVPWCGYVVECSVGDEVQITGGECPCGERFRDWEMERVIDEEGARERIERAAREAARRAA